MSLFLKAPLFVCVVALAIDSLFFFIPVIDSHKFCFNLDKKLVTAVCVLRTFIDTFYLLPLILNFMWLRRNEYAVSRFKAIRIRGCDFNIIVGIVSVLPIPQVMVLTLASRKQKTSLVSKQILKWVMFCQSIPRSIRIYHIYKVVTVYSGMVSQTKWVAAALNLILYLLPSHVIGAFWYLNAIEKKETCWREACAKIAGCNLKSLLCARGAGGDNSRFLNTSCPLIDPEQITNSTVFNFGIYTDALKSGVVETRDFPRKLLYCFWWGLRNISALGQNLETSNSAGEILFAIIICVSGVLLFAALIGNVQRYLTSLDEWFEKKRALDNWKSSLPKDLKKKIRRHVNYTWEAWEQTGEVKAFLRSLTQDVRLETKRHIYSDFSKHVPWLSCIDDDWLLEELCDRVKPVFYSAKSYILVEGDPFKEMLIVMNGELESMTESCETSSYSDLQIRLMKGDVWEDLLFWALDPHPSPSLPISNRTVKTLTDVRALTLSADDLKFLAYHLKRYHSVKLQHIKHIFRCHSESWRSWAAFYIQAAWRARCRRKGSTILLAKKDKQQILQDTQRKLGATLYGPRFVSKPLRYRHVDSAECSNSSEMLPHKPDNPKFPKEEV